jgi:hypothetical protein
MTKKEKIANQEAINKLIEAGAENLKTEDRHGETKAGWWMDGVYLDKKATDALKALYC